MFQFLYLIIFIQAARIKQIQNDSLSFEIPVQETITILSLYSAKDSVLITNSSTPDCELNKLSLEFETATKTFDSIVTMAHIRDGLIVITSDFFLYMLKFNYTSKGAQFLNQAWKADFKELGIQRKNELPDLIYCDHSNQALLFYTNTLMIFSVLQMEQKQANLQVRELTEFKQRKERGITKIVDNYIFTCVGDEGLDIYRIVSNEVHFLHQILNHSVKDLTIIKQDSLYQIIILDDLKPGIAIYQMDVSKLRIDLKLLYELNTLYREYIAVDNYNNNIFIVYELHNRFRCLEYQFTSTELILLNQFQTFSKIKDVDVTSEFAILQGQNKHHIMYLTKFDGLQIKHVSEYTQAGVIDIDFFTLTSIDIKMSHVNSDSDFEFYDFFFGISNSGIFITKFKVQPPFIQCYSQSTSTQYYQIVQNETFVVDNQFATSTIVQRTTNFSISFYVPSNLTSFGLLLYLGIPIGLTILGMGICYWFIQQMKEIDKLETEVATIKSKKSTGLAAAVDLPQIMQVIGPSPFSNTARTVDGLQKQESIDG